MGQTVVKHQATLLIEALKCIHMTEEDKKWIDHGTLQSCSRSGTWSTSTSLPLATETSSQLSTSSLTESTMSISSRRSIQSSANQRRTSTSSEESVDSERYLL